MTPLVFLVGSYDEPTLRFHVICSMMAHRLRDDALLCIARAYIYVSRAPKVNRAHNRYASSLKPCKQGFEGFTLMAASASLRKIIVPQTCVLYCGSSRGSKVRERRQR